MKDWWDLIVKPLLIIVASMGVAVFLMLFFLFWLASRH